MSYYEEEMLPLSDLQHFAFCRRQWALLRIENLWQENLLTTEGHLFHTRAHDEQQPEWRDNTLILRSLPVSSPTLGLSGQCDVVEFRQDPAGVSLRNEPGCWQPYPIEYKRGKPKRHNADELQLCAQAMCLEEMLCCSIVEGALFYGEPRRRTIVDFTVELRLAVRVQAEEMHQLFRRSFTPKVKPRAACNTCSLKELCLPTILKKRSVNDYLARAMEDTP